MYKIAIHITQNGNTVLKKYVVDFLEHRWPFLDRSSNPIGKGRQNFKKKQEKEDALKNQ